MFSNYKLTKCTFSNPYYHTCTCSIQFNSIESFEKIFKTFFDILCTWTWPVPAGTYVLGMWSTTRDWVQHWACAHNCALLYKYWVAQSGMGGILSQGKSWTVPFHDNIPPIPLWATQYLFYYKWHIDLCHLMYFKNKLEFAASILEMDANVEISVVVRCECNLWYGCFLTNAAPIHLYTRDTASKTVCATSDMAVF